MPLTPYPSGDILSVMRTFGRRLIRLRTQQGLRQLDLARRARVPQGYLSALEAGTKSNPGMHVLKKLAKALDVSVAALVE